MLVDLSTHKKTKAPPDVHFNRLSYMAFRFPYFIIMSLFLRYNKIGHLVKMLLIAEIHKEINIELEA